MKWITVGVLISALVSTSAYAGPADGSVTRAGGGIRKSVEQIRFSSRSAPSDCWAARGSEHGLVHSWRLAR